MSTDPDQPARIKLPTRNDRDWSAMRAPLAHLMRLAETRSQSVHHHRHTMPLGVWRRHLGMGRVPIWAQWSIIGVGIMSSPLLLLLALVPSAGCCFAGSRSRPLKGWPPVRQTCAPFARRARPSRGPSPPCPSLGAQSGTADEPPSRSKVAPKSSKTRAVLPSWRSSYRCGFDGRPGTDGKYPTCTGRY